MAGEAIGASSVIGLAFETTHGTYAAPTKFFPVDSTSLMRNQENYKRRVIRGTADQIGQVAGDAIVEGTIEMEALHDVLPYFLYAGRTTVVKSGAGPFTYACVPNDIASVPDGRTLSITQVRNGQVFGYTGCVVGTIGLTLDANILKMRVEVMGEEEVDAAVPTAVWPVSAPFGAGSYVVELDDTVADDFDGWDLSINNNASAEYRVEGTNGASFIRFGERETTLSISRDFKSKADYNAFKALTAQKVDMTATDGTHSIYMEIPAAIKQTYEIPITGQGDLIQAQIEYDGVYDAAIGASAQIDITTTEDIT